MPQFELDEILEGTPDVQAQRAVGPLFERHSIDMLRSIVRRSVAADFLGWAHGTQAKEMTYIIGVTKDAYVFYSDGIGMTGQRLEVVAKYMLERTHAALVAGKRYDPLVVEFIRYGGVLPSRPGDGSC